MAPRAAINNGVITLVIVFFMIMVGMLLKARYRLTTNEAQVTQEESSVPKAIPVTIATVPEDEQVQEARAYRQGEWWVLPHPELVISRANEADTLRIRSGPKEDIFVLYFVDALEVRSTRPQKLREQETFYQNVQGRKLLQLGGEALAWVSDTLRKYPFVVYTMWNRVQDTERSYAMIRVEMEPGKTYDLGELLVRRGFASPAGMQINSLPESGPSKDEYLKSLGRALTQAKVNRAGAWAFSPGIAGGD